MQKSNFFFFLILLLWSGSDQTLWVRPDQNLSLFDSAFPRIVWIHKLPDVLKGFAF